MNQKFGKLNFMKKYSAKNLRANLSAAKDSVVRHAKASLPVLAIFGFSLLLNQAIYAQGPIFTGDAGNLSNIIREGLKLMGILLFCMGAVGIGWAIVNKMTGKEYGSQAIGGLLSFAFATIVAVFWRIAQGQAVSVDTNF
jgi:phosphotransferase system  glucose/maltose/N-acetylglucosamine-specific IIC component